MIELLTAGGGARSAERPGAAAEPGSGGRISACRWQTPRGPVELGSREIDLWRADLGSSEPAISALERTLAPAECAKADRFHFERDRNRYILAHGALRTILGQYLKIAPGELAFGCRPEGKPELENGALRFNLSSSQDLVLCAISRAGPVGVDVERVRPGVEEDLAAYLSPSAARALEALAGPLRRRAVFEAWTRMEACSKVGGEGLGSGMGSFELFLEPPQPGSGESTGSQGHRSGWWLQDINPRRGYVGALAAGHAPCRLRFWEWDAAELAPPVPADPSESAPGLQSIILAGARPPGGTG